MDDLLGKSTVKRRKAAKHLYKKDSINNGECLMLLEGLKLEKPNGRHWETEKSLLLALGKHRCAISADYIYSNYIESDNLSLLGTAVSSYIRIKRGSSNDCTLIIRFLNSKFDLAVEGALEVLGYDKIIPSEMEQKEIIDLCFSFGKDRPRGVSDPRYGLAAACAGWNQDIVRDFLVNCSSSGDAPLEYVAKISLKGKYVKLR